MAVDRTRLPLPGPDPAFRLPAFERAELGGGAAVWAAAHRRAPLVALQLLLPVGSAADPPDTPGLAALTTELLAEGTAERSAVELETALKRIGGVLTAAVGSDATVVALTVLSRHLATGLRLLLEVAMRPRFAADDIVRERDLRINRIRQQRQSPGYLADRAFLEALYGDHPYGHLSIGTEPALRSVEPAGVADFHRRVYAAAPWTLVAAGDADPAAVIAEARRAWTAVGAPEVARRTVAPPPDPPPVRERMVFVARDGAVQSEIRLGHAGPPRSSGDYHALAVLNMVLGGQFVSRVNQNLREARGYTYGASTAFDWRRGRGPFRLHTSVQTPATVDALREAVGEVAGIRGLRPPSAPSWTRSQPTGRAPWSWSARGPAPTPTSSTVRRPWAASAAGRTSSTCTTSWPEIRVSDPPIAAATPLSMRPRWGRPPRVGCSGTSASRSASCLLPTRPPRCPIPCRSTRASIDAYLVCNYAGRVRGMGEGLSMHRAGAWGTGSMTRLCRDTLARSLDLTVRAQLGKQSVDFCEIVADAPFSRRPQPVTRNPDRRGAAARCEHAHQESATRGLAGRRTMGNECHDTKA